MSSTSRAWWGQYGPVLGLCAISTALGAAYTLRQAATHPELPPLDLPAHYALVPLKSGNFDSNCVLSAWPELGWPESPSFAPGRERERQLATHSLPDGTQLRLSLRDLRPERSVLQIEFVQRGPASPDEPAAREASRVLRTLGKACGDPQPIAQECGRLQTSVCRLLTR